MLKKTGITFLLILISFSIFAQESNSKTNAEREALFIYNFSKYIEWPNFNTLKEFRIGVIGDEYNFVCEALTNISKTQQVKGIPIKIERVNYDTKLEELQLLYFDNSQKTEIKTLYKAIKNNPVLLVGKGYPFGQSMINFITINNKIEFELDENKCKKVGLKVNVVIKTLAIKTKREWESLVEKMETIALQNDQKVEVNTKDLESILAQQKELEKIIAQKKETLAKQNEQIELSEKRIAEKQAQIDESTKELIKQKELVTTQNKKLSIQQKNLDKLNFSIVTSQIKLSEQQEKLEKDKLKLNSIKAEVSEIENELNEKIQLVVKNETQIKLQTNELKNKSSKIKQQKNVIWISILFLITVSILGLLAYRSYKLKNKANKIVLFQKQEIEHQHKEIIDSINYAKRLQNAIFPPLGFVTEQFPQSFIYFNPKDVVSGDFYWMEVIEQPNNELNKTIYFAAADCTGHGVPGAMVSVVCNNALNRSVREYGLKETGKLLNKTREIVVNEFAKSSEDVKDGMDIALCCIQFSESGANLQFSGANNPLWIVRKADNSTIESDKCELIRFEDSTSTFMLCELKSDKQPIGKIDNPKPYTCHNIKLQKGDTIYIFTDGYADQFGGEKGKKFMYKPLKSLLLSIQNKTMLEQKEFLANQFVNWKGNLEQVDDVCIIGVRI